MGEDIEFQSLENLLDKFLPVEHDKPFTFFKRYLKNEENQLPHQLVLKSSIPWHIKIPWGSSSLFDKEEFWSQARTQMFYKYSSNNFNFKSLLESRFSRLLLKTRVGYSKDGVEFGVAQGTNFKTGPEYIDAFLCYSQEKINSRVNFLYIPETKSIIMTTSGLFTGSLGDFSNQTKRSSQISGAEFSYEISSVKLLRAILFHRRPHNQNNKLTVAYLQKNLFDEGNVNRFLAGYEIKPKSQQKLLGYVSYDLQPKKLVFHLLYSRPFWQHKASRIQYKMNTQGVIGTDLLIRRRNILLSCNLEMNALSLYHKEQYGLFKLGVRFETIQDKNF